MTSPARHGFTLVELMLAVVVMLIVSGTLYQLLLRTQQLTRAQVEQVGVQSNLRGAVLAVASELRELATVENGDGAQNDILRVAPNALTYRAMRGTGFTCQSPTASQIRIGRSGFSGHREPQPGRDSALVYLEPAPDSEPTWIPVAITGVSATATCPGSVPALTLTTPVTASLAGIAAGWPVRIYELMELRLYRSDNHSWLGTRSVSSSESIQPLFGPLRDGDGFGLAYLDRAGRSTSSPTEIKSIDVTVRAVRSGAGVEESLTTRVALRNAF